jgi:hypothetical protein
MIEDGGVRPDGCICEPSSDISPNWRDIRTIFRYTTLGEMAAQLKRSREMVDYVH